MSVIVIGSTALNYHLPNYRDALDLDIVGTYDELEELRKARKPKVFYPMNSGKKMFMKTEDDLIVEADIAWPDSVADKLRTFILSQPSDVIVDGAGIVPSLNVLYMLKMSHRYLKDSPHFLKTMRDIHVMREAGAFIQPEHQAFYEDRMKDTYVYAHPKLDVSKGTFFDAEATGVEYTYDHDSIHEAVKHLDRPAYQYYKPDQNEVHCSKDMFYAAGRVVQLYGVLEEAYVLALERSLIPHPGLLKPKQAFDMALMKVCTSITSGWFREYAWEHYDDVQALYSDTYVNKFKFALDNGIVKPYSGAMYNTTEGETK